MSPTIGELSQMPYIQKLYKWYYWNWWCSHVVLIPTWSIYTVVEEIPPFTWNPPSPPTHTHTHSSLNCRVLYSYIYDWVRLTQQYISATFIKLFFQCWFEANNTHLFVGKFILTIIDYTVLLLLPTQPYFPAIFFSSHLQSSVPRLNQNLVGLRSVILLLTYKSVFVPVFDARRTEIVTSKSLTCQLNVYHPFFPLLYLTLHHVPWRVNRFLHIYTYIHGPGLCLWCRSLMM